MCEFFPLCVAHWRLPSNCGSHKAYVLLFNIEVWNPTDIRTLCILFAEACPLLVRKYLFLPSPFGLAVNTLNTPRRVKWMSLFKSDWKNKQATRDFCSCKPECRSDLEQNGPAAPALQNKRENSSSDDSPVVCPHCHLEGHKLKTQSHSIQHGRIQGLLLVRYSKKYVNNNSL